MDDIALAAVTILSFTISTLQLYTLYLLLKNRAIQIHEE